MANIKKMIKNQRGTVVAPGILPGIGLDQLKKLKCVCGNEVFIPCSGAYLASPLQSARGIPTLVQVPQGFVCSSCGKVNEYQQDIKEPTGKGGVSENVKN